MSALDVQEGGCHYKDRKIQPVEYIQANRLGYIEGNIVKYVTRWRDKNGLQDLKKIKHYVDLLIELEDLEAKEEELPFGEFKIDLSHLSKFDGYGNIEYSYPPYNIGDKNDK